MSNYKPLIICGTGHRPKDLPWKYNELDPRLRSLLGRVQDQLINLDPVVITGMALGWDTYLAECALAADCELWAYIPFEGQELRWPKESKDRYYRIMDQCTKVKVISDKFSMASYQDRNEAMVNDSHEVWSLWTGKENGGTYNCIKYAESQGKTIKNFWKEQYKLERSASET